MTASTFLKQGCRLALAALCLGAGIMCVTPRFRRTFILLLIAVPAALLLTGQSGRAAAVAGDAPVAAPREEGQQGYSVNGTPLKALLPALADRLDQSLLAQGNLLQVPVVLESRRTDARQLLIALAVSLQSEWRSSGEHLVLTDAPGLEPWVVVSEEFRRIRSFAGTPGRSPLTARQVAFMLAGNRLPVTVLSPEQQRTTWDELHFYYVSGRLHPSALLPGTAYFAQTPSAAELESGADAQLQIGLFAPDRHEGGAGPLTSTPLEYVQTKPDRPDPPASGCRLLRLPAALTGRLPAYRGVKKWKPSSDEKLSVEIKLGARSLTVSEILRRVARGTGLNLLAATHFSTRPVHLPTESERADRLLDLIVRHTGSNPEWWQVGDLKVLQTDPVLELEASGVTGSSQWSLLELAGQLEKSVTGKYRDRLLEKKRLAVKDLPKDFARQLRTIARAHFLHLSSASPELLHEPDFDIVMAWEPALETLSPQVFRIAIPCIDGRRRVVDPLRKQLLDMPPPGKLLQLGRPARAN